MAEQSVEPRATSVPRPASVSPAGPAAVSPAARDLSYLPPSAPPRNHGHTTAAWTTVVLVLVGSTVASVAVLFAWVWLFWVGLAVVALGIAAGKVLQILGHGQGGAATLEKQGRTAGH